MKSRWECNLVQPLWNYESGSVSLSVMSDSATLWTLVCQAPQSIGFSRQEYLMGCHSLLQGIFLTQGSNSGLLHCRQILYRPRHQEVRSFLRKFKIELPYHLAIPLLGIYPKRIKQDSKPISAHCSNIHNSEMVKKTQMSIHTRINKENMVYT